MNIWDPTVDEAQEFSLSQPWILSGNFNVSYLNSIEAGWKALTFYSCNNLKLENLILKDSQQIHLQIQKCSGVQASDLSIAAPETSPNTDGIHITSTQNLQIYNAIIKTGDDCILIVTGSKNIKASKIVCGPGHDIS